MQFNNTITLSFNSYNDFGEETSPTTHEIKCAILSVSKKQEKSSSAKSKRLEMVIMVAYKSFAPYSNLFSDDSATFTYGAIVYEPAGIEVINSFQGQPKFYELVLKELKRP